MRMELKKILIIFILLKKISCEGVIGTNEDSNLQGFCKKDSSNEECNKSPKKTIASNLKYVLYDVNPPEGFNLRRDVYMRMAVFVHNLKKLKRFKDVKLVLPPWNHLYHWRSRELGRQANIPWSLFFDIPSLQSFAPVKEFNDVFSEQNEEVFIDRIYLLKHFDDAFQAGEFKEKWEIQNEDSCRYFNSPNDIDIIANKIECVAFQGSASKLRELMNLHPNEESVMFANAEIALHDEYGTSMFWASRKSMKFNKELIKLATDFIAEKLDCKIEKCDNYLGVHWRRADFAKSRYKEVPSIEGTAKQIKEILNAKYKNIKIVFVATDATDNEFDQLTKFLHKYLVVKRYIPTDEVKSKFKDGGVAIIDQIICSHAAYFVGTHESTFSFRIQEEREIMGFDSSTTFNRLCPDSGACEKPSKWKIVH